MTVKRERIIEKSGLRGFQQETCGEGSIWKPTLSQRLRHLADVGSKLPKLPKRDQNETICRAPHDVVHVVVAWLHLRLRGDRIQPGFELLCKVDADYSLANVFFLIQYS